MFSDAELQLAYKVGNAPFSMFPYPHFYIPDVFPADFYRQLQQNLPDPQAMIPIEEARQLKGYKERFVWDWMPKAWRHCQRGSRRSGQIWPAGWSAPISAR